MLIKGTFVSQPSGSLGGITAAHNRSGTYLRARTVPVNPNTVYQQSVRNWAGNLATAWVTALTEVQRAAWDLYASNVAMVNRVGDTIYLTGLNHYIRSNVPRLQNLEDRIDDAPTVFALTEVTTPSITFSEATQLGSLVFENTDPWANDDDGALCLSISRPENQSINYFKGPYRFTGSVEGNSTTPPTSPAPTPAPFPFVEGQRLFAQLRAFLGDGRVSAPLRIYADAEA